MKRSNADSIGAKRERRFKRRAILITEGAKTEIGYFKAFTDSKEFLGINDLIDVVLLDRFHQDVGLSDPLRILDLSKEYMHASRTDVCPLNLFVGMCAESAEGHVSDIKGVRESLKRRLMGAGLVLDGFIRDIEHAKDIAAELLFEEGIEDISIAYSVVKTTVDDPVYIIVDRDMSDSGPRRSTVISSQGATMRDSYRLSRIPISSFGSLRTWTILQRTSVVSQMVRIQPAR